MRPRGERGPLEPVYDRDSGRLLTVPVHASLDALRSVVDPGRYRLDPIGADGQLQADAQPAYVEVIAPRQAPVEADDATGPWTESDNTEREAMRLCVRLAESVIRSTSAASRGHDDLLRDSMRANTRLAEALIAALPPIMTATGGLITAADGAGIAHRQPAALPPPPAEYEEDEDEDDDDDEADEGEDDASRIPPWLSRLFGEALEKMVPAVLPKIAAGLSNMVAGGGLGIPPEALIDWRKAAPRTAPIAPPSPPAPTATSPNAAPPAAPVVSVATSAPVDPAPPAAHGAHESTPSADSWAPNGEPGPVDAVASPPVAAPPPSTPTVDALDHHILQIWTALTTAERGRAQQRVMELEDKERNVLLNNLMMLSTPDAVALVRSLLHVDTTLPEKSS
jgi:hypothetical protein